jgi:hypothetical protein
MKHVQPSHLRIVSSSHPATQPERDAMTFEPLDLPFKWTNEDWTQKHLPWVRLASAFLQEDHSGMQERFAQLAPKGVLPGALDEMCATKQHLLDCAQILDIAVTRSFLVLERLGYSPENPPPDGGEEGSVEVMGQ